MAAMSIPNDPVDAHWRIAPHAAFTDDRKDWLTRGGSLTAHLRTLGSVIVEVTREAVDIPWQDEWHALGVTPRTPVWTREVILRVDGVPLVAAHSIVALSHSTGVWQSMRRLRARPLAELLYSDSSVSRSMLASRVLTARHPMHRLASRQADTKHALVARRSVFERHGAPLMVTECMLDTLWAKLAAIHGPHRREHARSYQHLSSHATRVAHGEAR